MIELFTAFTIALALLFSTAVSFFPFKGYVILPEVSSTNTTSIGVETVSVEDVILFTVMLPLWPISISSNFIVESELTLSVKAVLVISVNDEIFLITPSM